MKQKKGLLVVGGLAVIVFAALSLFMRYYGDWLWFRNIGFGQVFTTVLWAKILSFAVFFLIFAIETFLSGSTW